MKKTESPTPQNKEVKTKKKSVVRMAPKRQEFKIVHRGSKNIPDEEEW